MKQVHVGCVAAFFVTAVLVVQADSRTVIGYHQTGGVSVPAGETVTLANEVLVGDGGAFSKTGDGTLVVPMAKVNRTIGGWEIRNHAGTMRIEPGADTTAAAVPAVIAEKAALWLRADSAVVTNASDGTAQYVKKWVDVRDMETPDAPRHVYATPAWSMLAPETSSNKPPVLVEKDGTSALYFGGPVSGKYMKFSAAVTGIRQNFIVHGMYDCWGAVLGNSGSSRSSMIPDTYAGVVATNDNKLVKHFSLRTELSAAYSAGRYHLDGMVFDPYTTPPVQGFQLLECEFPVFADTANQIFRCNFETIVSKGVDLKVQGGDYVSEIILFTNVLEEADRVDVERYLMRRWSLPRAGKVAYLPSPGAVVAVSNSVVELHAAAGESLPIIDLRGGGTFRKTGDGTLELGPAGEDPFTGTFLWEGGTLFSRGGRPPAVKAEAGDRFEAAVYTPYTYSTARTPLIDIDGGAKLTRTADAGAGKVVKTGNDWVRVDEVASDVTRLEVNEGVFALEAKAHAPESYATNLALSVVVTNADFELPYDVGISDTDLGSIDASNVNAQNGWTGSAAGYVAYTNRAKAWFGGVKIPPSSGSQVLRLNGTATASVTVDLPVAGWYEMTVRAKTRYGTGNGATQAKFLNEAEVLFGADASSLTYVGHLWPSGLGFARYAFTLPYASAGPHVLRFKTTNRSFDCALLLDDVEIHALARPPENAAFKVPNGDFERLDVGENVTVWAGNTGLWTGCLSPVDNFPAGWTFDVSGSDIGSATKNGCVGLASPAFSPSSESFMVFGLGSLLQGPSRLFFFRANGKASTTFTLPAGRYRLRADMARHNLAMTPGGLSEKDVEGSPVFAASVTRSGQTIALGSVTRNTFLAEKCYWPNILEVSEPQEVTLTLTQTAGAKSGETQGSGWVDNLEFMPVADQARVDNLLSAPDADTDVAKSWTFTFDRSFFANSKADVRNYNNGATTKNYGYSAFNGSRYFYIQSAGTMRQRVTIPEAGLYRFMCHARTRADSPSYCGNNLRVWYAAAGSSVTNYVDTLLMHYTGNYLERAWLLRFDAAGDYDLGVTGLGVESAGVKADRESHLDGLSLRRVVGTVDDVPAMPPDLKVAVAEGARLVLDFPGTNTVRQLKLGDLAVPPGLVDANDYPDYLGGIGTLFVKPAGTVIILR